LPLEEYGKFYALFDISLAYVEHNAFNSCKSEIKVVESLRYGCIPVFSNYGGYKTFSDNVPSSISLKNLSINFTAPNQWISAISNLINNYDESKNRALELKKWSDDIYNINNSTEERLSFYLDKSEEFNEEWYNTNIAKYIDYSG